MSMTISKNWTTFGQVLAMVMFVMAGCGQDIANGFQAAQPKAMQNARLEREPDLALNKEETVASTRVAPRSHDAGAHASVVAPEFDVARAAYSPNGDRLVLVGKGVAATLMLATADLGSTQQTGIERPAWVQYAPDGSEIWIGDRRGRLKRLHPQSGAPIVSNEAWVTEAGGIKIVSPRMGEFALEQDGHSVDVFGRIVAGPAGQLEFGGGVFVARRPDTLVRFSNSGLSGDVDLPMQPVGAMAVACDGKCLLTATTAQSPITYLWSLLPYSPTPSRLEGRVFLDAGNAAMDASGEHILMLSKGGLWRLRLPLGTADGLPLSGAVNGARLSGNAHYAFVLDDTRGWRIYNAADMSPVPEPDWLDAEQQFAAVAPGGRRAVFADRSGSLRLTDEAYGLLCTFDVDPELAEFRFSSTGAFLAYRRDDAFALFSSAVGAKITTLPGKTLLFSPDDHYVVTLGVDIWLLRLPSQNQ